MMIKWSYWWTITSGVARLSKASQGFRPVIFLGYLARGRVWLEMLLKMLVGSSVVQRRVVQSSLALRHFSESGSKPRRTQKV